MMNRYYVLIGFLFAVLVGCKQQQAQEAQANMLKPINIYTKEGQLLKTISEAKKIQMLQKALANRTRVFVKMMPIFKYYFAVDLGSKNEQWLFTDSGFIMLITEGSNIVYKIEDQEALGLLSL